MGYFYNSICSDQTCSGNCCSWYGSCPVYNSLDVYQNSCYYYYRYIDKNGCDPKTYSTCCFSQNDGYYQCQSSGVTGIIIGSVVGSFSLLVAIIILVICCLKKHQQNLIRGNPNTTNFIQVQPFGQQRINSFHLNPAIYSSPQKVGQDIYSQPVDIPYLHQNQYNPSFEMMKR